MDHLTPYTHVAEPLPVDTMAAILLLDLFRNPDRDIDSIVEFISNDPTLMAETLKRCNRVSFCGFEPVTDIFEAVSRLGFYELYDIVAASTSAQTSAPEVRMTAELEALQALPKITI